MKKTSEKVLFRGNWLTLIEKSFVNSADQPFKWECIERNKNNLVVIIVARMVHSGQYVLIKQFRCPVNAYVLGFPAGVTELDVSEEEIESEALRELKEETGYIGKITGKSPVLKASTGIMDDNVIVLNAEIDDNAPENISPVQNLEPEEDIQVILKTREEIRGFLLSEYENNVSIGVGVWNLFCIL